MPFHSLPQPDSEALAYSQKLITHIKHHLQASGGKLTFAHFMQLALYTPGLGYYSSGRIKFGQQGDFVTAPEISPLFGYCIACQCQQILTILPHASILELGAGSGRLAADILSHLATLNCLPQHYFILELSAELRQRQQALLQKYVPTYYPQIVWLNSLPNPQSFTGIMLANEVMDALPVHLFRLDQTTFYERYVTCHNDQLVWEEGPPSSQALRDRIAQIKHTYLPDAASYLSEINLQLAPWITSLAQSLAQGVILLIDYGFPREEYYHPQRNQGTLMCHFHHYAHSDPLLYPGLQDITAHVDFTLVAESAKQAGLEVLGYTNQAWFLLKCGLMELATQANIEANSSRQLRISQQLQKLTLPHEMGELFKVIALGRNFPTALIGFAE